MSSTQERIERRLDFSPAGGENRFDDSMIDTGESFLQGEFDLLARTERSWWLWRGRLLLLVIWDARR